jgi:hypothetical protein
LVTKLFRTSLFLKKKKKGFVVKIFVCMSISFQGNTHPCHLNLGSNHPLAMIIVEQDAPMSIVEKNDFNLVQGDFLFFLK